MRRALPIVAAALLGGCATTAGTIGVTPFPVFARAQTQPVGTADADAADDPAIWRNPEMPGASLIVATDKQAGLYVYGLDGKVRSFTDSGRVNNVDLIDMGSAGVIVVASDRNDLAQAKLQVFRLDTMAGALVPLGVVDGGQGEGYGLCLGRDGDALLAYSVLKDGTVSERRIVFAGKPVAEPLRTFKVPTQAEGCVVDRRNGTLYLAEEDAGIWRFRKGENTGKRVVHVDNRYLVADVEGLAIAPLANGGGYLIASSQGDNAYAVFRLGDLQPLDRFRIVAGTFGAVEETDGIDLVTGDFGSGYEDGLFVVQDGANGHVAQNFKLLSWGDIMTRLSR